MTPATILCATVAAFCFGLVIGLYLAEPARDPAPFEASLAWGER